MTDRLIGTDRLYRFHSADMEIRTDGEGRTIHGVLAPYGTATRIGGSFGYDETLTSGMFAKSIKEHGHRAKLMVGHQLEKLPIGRAVELREEPARLYGAFTVSRTAEGDDALQRVRDGAVDAFSIEFQPLRSEWNEDRTAVTRLEGRLFGVSLVAYPAYEGALIGGVRSVFAVANALDRFPDLETEIRDLIESRVMNNETDPTDAADEPVGTLVGDDDTPTPAGHLSETQQRAIDDLKGRLDRLTTGDTTHVGEDL